MSTAEPIAKVVADLRAGPARLRPTTKDRPLFRAALSTAGQGPVVDATAIYESIVAKDEPVYIYEDHPCIAPPWEDASICYVNEHGNVLVVAFRARDYNHDDPRHRLALEALERSQRKEAPPVPVDLHGPWQTAEVVEWERVKWIANSFVWLGGSSPIRGPLRTSGPVHMWQFAVYEDGTPADLHWVHLIPEYDMQNWDMAQLVLLGALNFLNCRNVELVEPQRPRREARRIGRTGVHVSTINVFPVGRASRSRTESATSGGVPLTSVRGHFACYGPKYGRGLLFGKHEGRFWIPQHARGAADAGVSEHDYRLVMESAR